jgi:UDP-glucose-4-epimerase GalE
VDSIPEAVLVVGGAGYIGSHAALTLKRQGFLPVLFDNFFRGNRFVSEEVSCPLVEGSINDSATLLAIFERWKPIAVMHFAAKAYVGESVSAPLPYYETNVGGLITLLSAMRTKGIRRLIFSSTCATYGCPSTTPISENTPQLPINPYGRSKLMAEEIIADACASSDLKAVVFRYFNAAGADHSGRIGELHRPETHLIPLAFKAVAHGVPLVIFGNDYPTKDGTCVRDYIHVNDIAEAHTLGLQHLLTGGNSLTVNLGHGSGYSIIDVLKMVAAVTGKPVPTKIGKRRPGDPPILIADASRAYKFLGWSPTQSDLRTIVESAWNWHQSEIGQEGIIP